MLSEVSDTDDLISNEADIKVYKKRWFIALLLCYENLLNAYLWIGYAPVINMAIVKYQTEESIFNFSAAIFPFITVIFGFPTIWVIVKYGLRFTFLIAGLLNFICCFGRFICSIVTSLPPNAKISIFILSQFLGAFAQSFVMFTPANIALSWFPDNQRTTANSIAALGNPFGVMLGSLLAPILVKSPQEIINFDLLTLCMGIFGVILLLPVIRSAEPPNPPSYAAYLQKRTHNSQDLPSFKEQMKNFIRSLKIPLKNSSYVFIIFLFGLCLTYFTMVSAYIQQMLCTKGYSNKFAGTAGAVMILSGLIFAAITAPIVDYTRSLFTSVKVFFCLALMGLIAWSVSLFFINLHALIIISLVWWGGFSFASYSLLLELSAEITYPVPETITSGILIIISQIMSVIVLPIFQYTGVTDYTHSVCGPDSVPKDYSISNFVLVGVLVVMGIAALFVIKGSYLRRQASDQIIEIENSSTPVREETIQN